VDKTLGKFFIKKKAVITKGEARYSPNKLKRLAEKELNS